MIRIWIIILAIALLGAVLGVMNTWREMMKDRVKIKIIPKIGCFMRGGFLAAESNLERMPKGIPYILCIEVINMSSFAVTISEVGFGQKELRHVLTEARTISKKPFPTRLEPREAVTVFQSGCWDLEPNIMRRAVAYARTVCNIVRYGSSPAFKTFVKHLLKVVQ